MMDQLLFGNSTNKVRFFYLATLSLIIFSVVKKKDAIPLREKRLLMANSTFY